MGSADHRLPRARDEGLIIHELPDETLIYDLERHRAHALNGTAAWVWRHCDGDATVGEMAALLQDKLRTPIDEAAVWLALGRLEKAHLLCESLPPAPHGTRSSRRALVRRLAMAGGLALVTSIVAPEAAHAASCIGCGAQNKCTPAGTPCCFGCACLTQGDHFACLP